jgi:hypothetical protein
LLAGFTDANIRDERKTCGNINSNCNDVSNKWALVIVEKSVTAGSRNIMHQYLEQECQQQQGAINFWDASSNTSHRSHASNSRKASNIRDTNNSRNTSKSMEACSKDILPTKVAKIEKRRLQQNKNLYNQGSQQQQGSEQYIAEMQACNTCSFDISSSAETSEQ